MEKKGRDVGMEGQNRRRSPAVRLLFFFSRPFFVTIVTLEIFNEILSSFSALFYIGFSFSAFFLLLL